MEPIDKSARIGVLGAGTMGSGIAQVAASCGHPVLLCDADSAALDRARAGIRKGLDRLIEKGKLPKAEGDAILSRIAFSSELSVFGPAAFVIEAIVESLEVKREVFRAIETRVGAECVVATNTSSLSIAALGASFGKPGRFLGVHFFNPAQLMPLVEIVPGVATDPEVTAVTRALIEAWGKTGVLAKDTPGFIVNRIARPYYGEALRILEEGAADHATIDWAMREIGGFKMGPFELMDFIGNDINFQVTSTVFQEFFCEPRYRPSLTQKRMVEAGRLGRKSGRGYYDYSEGARAPAAKQDRELGQSIVDRVVAMLINEAADARLLGIASRDDIETAMTKGVNYPRGLLKWADEIGLSDVLGRLEALQAEYGEDRYRPSPLLRRMVREGSRFFPA